MRRIALLAVVGILVTDVAASIFEADDIVFGPGSITIDSSTNLEWLDLTETIGRSFDDVSNELGLNGDFEGWRYATAVEITEFWTNLGIPDINTAYSEAHYLPVLTLIGLVGSTGGGAGLAASFAMSADIASPTEVFSLWVQVNEGAFNPPRARARTGAVTLMNDPKSDIASWLVRQSPTGAIPEPSTFIVWSLLGMTVAGISWWKRRRTAA